MFRCQCDLNLSNIIHRVVPDIQCLIKSNIGSNGLDACKLLENKAQELFQELFKRWNLSQSEF